MRKYKSVFRIDFTTSSEATNYYFNLLKSGDIKKAREKTREKYGLATVHIVAATAENALRKFHKEFNTYENNLTYTNYETVICGSCI